MLESPLRIDPAQPLDPTHPLLRGLEGFWLPLPSTSGGARLYDLSVYGRDGTLTNMDPSTDWVTDPHVQHQGLDFDGTDDWVDLTTELKDVIGGASALAVTHQFKIPDTSSDKRLSSGWNTGDFQETSFAIWMDAGGNGTGYAFQIDLQDDSRSKVGEDNDGAVPGKVEVVTAVFEQGARTEIWKNGSLLSSATPGDSPVVEPPEISLGALGPTAVGDFSDLVLFSTLVHSRAPTSTEMLALHAQARRGFPDLLRTRSTAPLVSTSGGGGAVTISASLTEEATASSTFSARSILRSGITEGTQAADALGPTVSMADAVQEAANAGEQWASQLLATASVAEGAQGTEDFAASLASAVQGALTENSQASDDFLAALAQVASVTEAALADVSLDARQDLVAVMQEEATAGESLTASVFTLLTGAVNEGAAADEAWASNLRALANLTEEAQADEVFAATLEGILTGVLDENTEAAETFLAALDTSGTITESGQAGASFAAVRTLFASLQEEASASGDYDADLTLAAEIQEGATAAEDFTAQMRLVASVTEDVQAEDAYTAVGRVASLTATLQVTAALSASLDVSPDE